MDLILHVWRQAGPDQRGRMVTYTDEARDISPDMSFLEMLDIVNERLTARGEEPIAFDHDCREGICGSCGMMINGQAHGPQKGTATCQLHMRKFSDGDEIYIEPWRAQAFPVLRDLIVDRQAFDTDHRGRRLHHRPHRRRPRRQPHPRAEGGCGRGHGRRRLHRLRGVRGRVPQLGRPAVHGRQDPAPQPAASGPGRALRPDEGDGRHDGGVLRLLHEPCASARRRARRRSRSTSSPT